MYVCYSILTWSIVPKEWLGLYVRTGIQKMVALGYLYTLGKQTSHFPKCCTSRNTTGFEFLEVKIPPHVLLHDWDLYVLSVIC